MFTFDNTTIILSAVLLVMALLTPLVSPFFRKVRMTEPVLEDETDTEDAHYRQTFSAHLRSHCPSVAPQQ